MSLDSLIHSVLARSSRPSQALVLMGGGARTAYQAGVLKAMSEMLKPADAPDVPGATKAPFPFDLLIGTSAGALNVSYLAGRAMQGLDAFDSLGDFWMRIRSDDVYRLNISPMVRVSKLFAAFSLARHARTHGAILDNMPLVDTLHHAISLVGVEQALQAKAIRAVAVTASSYTSGVHWCFCHTRHDVSHHTWTRPGRRSEFQPLTIEHLMASSAIPFLFPATPLWVDGRREFFGDGSMRQVSPLSPALHLGASRILVVGVGQPQRSGLTGVPASAAPAGGPSLGSIAGHAMASVFHDTLQADVEQAQRVTRTLKKLPPDIAGALRYRPVEVMSIQPSQSLDAIAQAHVRELPRPTRNALAGLGALRGGGAALASYLLFEPGFVQTLMELGAQDAIARKDELVAFMTAEHESPSGLVAVP